MQTKTLALIASLLLLLQSTKAQTRSKALAYFGSVQTGFMVGSSDFDLSIETRHGIQYKGWVAALGTGYDGYGVPAVPITLYAQKSFTGLKHKPFLYGQSGIAVPLKINEWDDKTMTGEDRYNFETGFIAEAGIGYQWKLSKKLQLQLSSGFSYKQIKGTEEVSAWWGSIIDPINPMPVSRIDHWDYRYQRFTLRIGLTF